MSRAVVAQPSAAGSITLSFAPSFWLLRVLARGAVPDWGVRSARALVLFSLLSGIVLGASWQDQTLVLRSTNSGRGLLEHWGTLSQLLACPILALLCLRLSDQLALFAERPRVGDSAVRTIAALRGQLAALLHCTSDRCQALLGLLRFVGVCALVVNLQNTRRPHAVYGQDVWDGGAHPWGYLAGKVLLGFEWIYLLPIVAYACIAVCVTVLLLGRALVNNPVELSPFAGDGCGGFRFLGQPLLTVLYVDAVLAVVILAHIHTHEHHYASLFVASLLVGITAVLQLSSPVLRVHVFLRDARRERLNQLESVLRNAEHSLLTSAHVPVLESSVTVLAAQVLYARTAAVSTWPYVSADRFKLLSPLVPFATSILTKWLTA